MHTDDMIEQSDGKDIEDELSTHIWFFSFSGFIAKNGTNGKMGK